MTRTATLVLALLLLAGCSDGVAPGDPVERPNLLFIVTDDQRFDMMGIVNPMLQTPNMDRLAREGVRFEHAFVTTPICAASRASLLTGVVERTHRSTFGTPPLAVGFTDRSYPTLLRRAGYHTGFIGKFGVATEPGAVDTMFDAFVSLAPAPYLKEREDGSHRHLTDITADETIAYLRSIEQTLPFALTLSFNAPHADDIPAVLEFFAGRAVGLDAEEVAEQGPLRQLVDVVEPFVRTGERSCGRDVRMEPEAFYRIGRGRAREPGDFHVPKPVKGESRRVFLRIAPAAQRIRVCLPGIFGGPGSAPRGAVRVEALDLPGDGGHRIQRTVRIQAFAHAHPNGGAARPLHAQPGHPAKFRPRSKMNTPCSSPSLREQKTPQATGRVRCQASPDTKRNGVVPVAIPGSDTFDAGKRG